MSVIDFRRDLTIRDLGKGLSIICLSFRPGLLSEGCRDGLKLKHVCNKTVNVKNINVRTM